MKFKNKVVAAASATVMTAGMVMSSVPAFAGSEEMDFINSYNCTAREVAQYVIGEGCTIEEATEIMDIYLKGKAELEEDNNGINTYSEENISTEELFEYYSTKKLAPTSHHLVVIVNNLNQTYERVNFYLSGLTRNILAPELDSYRIWLNSNSVNGINSSLNYSSNDKWNYTISINELSSISNTEAKGILTLPITPGNTIVSEERLYKSVNFDYSTKDAEGLFFYEIYALGDVNHDAEVTEADATLLLHYLTNTTDLKLDYKDGSNHHSKITNCIASDANQDNIINLTDVIYINNYIGGSREL